MSKYTTEIRFICEQQSGLSESKGYFDVGEIIDKARPNIFDFPYPIFNAEYKPVLENKILMHYYTREISEETYGLWKLRLRSKMNEIMPYYNQLYESELIKFNPLWDTDIIKDRDIVQDNTHEDETVTDNVDKRSSSESIKTSGKDSNKTSGSDVTKTNNTEKSRFGGQDRSVLDGQDVSTLGGEDVTTAGGEDTHSGTRNDVTNTWDLYSDTPQGAIAGIQGAEDSPSLGDNGYLTDARHVFGDTDGSETSGTDTYGRTDTTEYGRTNTMEYGKINTTEYGKTGNITNDGSNTTQYGKTDTTEYGKNTGISHSETDNFDGNVKKDGTARDVIDFIEKITGYQGRNPSDSLMRFRETFLNIDAMIIKELKPLFFNLW